MIYETTPSPERCPICGNMPETRAYTHYQPDNRSGEPLYQKYTHYKVFCTRCELHACPHWHDMESAIRTWNTLAARIKRKIEQEARA